MRLLQIASVLTLVTAANGNLFGFKLRQFDTTVSCFVIMLGRWHLLFILVHVYLMKIFSFRIPLMSLRPHSIPTSQRRHLRQSQHQLLLKLLQRWAWCVLVNIQYLLMSHPPFTYINNIILSDFRSLRLAHHFHSLTTQMTGSVPTIPLRVYRHTVSFSRLCKSHLIYWFHYI